MGQPVKLMSFSRHNHFSHPLTYEQKTENPTAKIGNNIFLRMNYKSETPTSRSIRGRSFDNNQSIKTKIIPEKFRQTINYNQSLAEAARNGDEKTAQRIISDMKERDLEWTPHTYNAWINLYVNLGQIQKAIEEMKKGKILPDKITFNTLLNFYEKNKDLEKAEILFNEMIKAGIKDVVFCNRLIHLYVEKEDLDGAEKFLDRMELAGVQSNIVSFTIILTFFVRQKNVLGVERLLSKMEQKGIELDNPALNLLISYYWHFDREKALKLFLKIIHLHPIIIRKEGEILECHNLSHEAAYLMIDEYLKSKEVKLKFTIITGVGNSAHGNKFAMKKKIIEFLKNFYPQIEVDNKSFPGRLICKTMH